MDLRAEKYPVHGIFPLSTRFIPSLCAESQSDALSDHSPVVCTWTYVEAHDRYFSLCVIAFGLLAIGEDEFRE